MKKILLLILVLVFFGFQFCFAEEIEEDYIENEPLSEIQTNNEQEINNIFTNDPQGTLELHGYLEYDEIPDSTIYLDQVSRKTPDFKAPIKIGSKSLIPLIDKKPLLPDYKKFEIASRFYTQEYDINPKNSSYSEKSGNVTFGTMYNSGLDNASLSYSTGIFAKYDSKYWAFTSAFSKKTNSNYDSYNDRIFFAPELKITKRLSIMDVLQTDVQQINKKNEIVLRYTPNFKKYADDVQFELGAGQSFHEDNYINSSVRFSTRFKL